MSTQRDLVFERELLSGSDLFDKGAYVAMAGEEARHDPIGHYLEAGWRLGFEPNQLFPGSLLQPYFATLGADEPPAITWLTLRAAGWPLPGSREELEWAAHSIRNNGLFDEASYVAQLGSKADGLDPAFHYIVVGERTGFKPSAEFDPEYYASRNPDVAQASTNYLMHYAGWGRAEGRTPTPTQALTPGRAKFDPGKENVIVVVHETSRTGAPILGWNLALHLARRYNVFTVRMGDGDLTPEFEFLSAEVYGPFLGSRRDKTDVEYSLRPLLKARKYRYAIVNSAESRLVVEPCVRRFIPTVFLIHEFASYVHPLSAFCSALDWSTEVVFSARMVEQSAQESHPNLTTRKTHVIPQGIVTLPASGKQRPQDEAALSRLQRLTASHDADGTFVVLGAGYVSIRKGVDVFLSAAASVIRRHPRRKIHFLWVGEGYRPLDDVHYSVYLHEQLCRSGLDEHVTLLGGVPDLEPIYRITDTFLLSSRLDPLPNVTIDAAVRGIPVVCFRESSGMADLMSDDPNTAYGVVDYLDADAAAIKIIELAEDNDLRRRVSRAMVDLAHKSFDMEKYVAHLDTLASEVAARMQQRSADVTTLLADSTFDQQLFLGPNQTVPPRGETILHYLALGAARGWGTPPTQDHMLRRPAPGFNPRIYAAANPSRLASGADPLADFVRQGKPAGPWQSTVLRPDDPHDQVTPAGRLRVALHAHFFYPELCGDFLLHFGASQTNCDLLISTDDSTKAEQLRRSLRWHSRGRVVVRVVPNRGRDIGPLLTGFANDLDDYDLIGHVHAKRSKWSGSQATETTWGDSWREFLWQNMLGGIYPMMDRIVAAFEQDKSLGLVFPSDPNLVGWDDNRTLAAEFAARIGWEGALPEHFDFPLGNMFWVRREALQPLLNLRLTWDNYPEEPVPHDGTLLHALERLPTIACQVAGFRCAVTHVPGISWSPAAF